MWWDVKFGCTFEVLDHMPRESSAIIILKHFQPDATLGRGRSYTEAAGHWASSGCMQGSTACGSTAAVCIGLILWTGPAWLKTCPRNKSMPGSSAMAWGLWSQILRCSKACLVSELQRLNESWAFAFHLGARMSSRIQCLCLSTQVYAHRYQCWTSWCSWHQRGVD